MADAPEASEKRADPAYHVCQVDPASPTKLTIIAPNVRAKSPVKAMDGVAETMEGEFALAVFLATGLRSKKYRRETGDQC